VLTREEEIALFKRLEKGDDSARRELIEANLRFVVKIALQFMGKGLPLSDLVQEGNIGLMEVINKFDWRKGYRFSTYAAFWIRQTIQLAIRRHNSLVKLPLRKARLMGRLTEFINTFQVKNGREPSEKEISQGVQVDMRNLETVMTWRESILSLDSQPNESYNASLYDFVNNSDTPTPRTICLEHERQEKIEQALSKLSERERKVLRLRYGFGGGEPLSLRKASKIIGLSQEGVRKIEKRALEKLRRPAMKAQLVGLL
ncbi:RNA polymerase sigma factor RpoD/SigA, partial [Candidatus Sumerlaeota bacterium]|nr:RNA polymerase sigma factor RpoD/SigA [Candidatus Sumerlaeota bacterium]